jgi:hypothetical protein
VQLVETNALLQLVRENQLEATFVAALSSLGDKVQLWEQQFLCGFPLKNEFLQFFKMASDEIRAIDASFFDRLSPPQPAERVRTEKYSSFTFFSN